MRGGFRSPRGGGGPGGMDPRAMARAMKQLGIEVEDLEDVEEVVIRTRAKDVVIRPASVSAMVQQGERSWQVTGTPTERPRSHGPPRVAAPQAPAAQTVPPGDTPLFTQADVDLVKAQAGVDEATAVRALRETGGEPAAAIVKLLEG